MTTKSEVERTMTEYGLRRPLLQLLADTLETYTKQLLSGLEHIDRVYFRAKDAESFAKKAISTDESGRRKYEFPLEDIEDQVAGRVLLFFRRDIEVVGNVLLGAFNRAEQVRKAPKQHDAFAYESEHFVFIIPPHVVPGGWAELEGRPTTFEMQVRTLFMHAWAEPEHDISYKAKVALTHEEKRKLAWAASSAWGGDAIFEQVLDSIAARSRSENGGD
jgi:ppGpp synthetase/RelA/SpoT-type nucleotidyltranferase